MIGCTCKRGLSTSSQPLLQASRKFLNKAKDRKFALVYQTNLNNLVSVNTPLGQTSRVNSPRIVQQGGALGHMQCSVYIDKIGRDCIKRKEHLYDYKNKIITLILAMVDDLLGIAPCGLESRGLKKK